MPKKQLTESELQLRDSIAKHVLVASKFWDSFKWNIIRSCIWKIISDSQPVAESEIEYLVDHDEETRCQVTQR